MKKAGGNKLIFGSFLSDVSSFSVVTADGIRRQIRNNLITKLALKLVGIPHLGLRIRATAMLKFLNPVKSDVILDAGCGMGLHLLTLANRISGGYGVDTDNSKITEAKRLAGELSANNLIFRNADVGSLDFPDAYFDKIICSEVLEHVQDDRKIVKNLFRILKKGGMLVVSTTSLSILNQRHQEKFSHERVGYSAEQLKALFTENGFCVEKILPYCLFFGQLAWRINRNSLSNSVLNALSFYPLMFIASLDKFLPQRLDSDCIGYIIGLKKE